MDSWRRKCCRMRALPKPKASLVTRGRLSSGGLLLLLCFSLSSAAEDAWFSATLRSVTGSYQVSARIRAQEVEVSKGDHRVLPHGEGAGSYQGLRLSWETQFRSADTTFHFYTQGLMRKEGSRLLPVWQNTVRSGVDDVEWSRRDFLKKPALAEFHSPSLGDGKQSFESEAWPEEFLYAMVPGLDSAHRHKEFKLLSPVWETPLSKQAWSAVADYTGTRLRLEGVDCYQVVVLRSDGRRAEYYVSQAGRLVMRFQTMQGTWFSRFQ